MGTVPLMRQPNKEVSTMPKRTKLTRTELEMFRPLATRRAEIMERWAAVEEKIGKHVTPQEVEEMLIRLLP
jgi:hypothetical protein